MTPEAILALINSLIAIAFQLHNTLGVVSGSEAIPTWGEIIDENKLLQDKIDAEKEAS